MNTNKTFLTFLKEMQTKIQEQAAQAQAAVQNVINPAQNVESTINPNPDPAAAQQAAELAAQQAAAAQAAAQQQQPPEVNAINNPVNPNPNPQNPQ